MNMGMRFRVATYNIRKAVGRDFRRRPDRILAVLEEIGASIVALQEADRRFGDRHAALPPEALANAGWHVVPEAPHIGGIGWLGNSILLAPSVTLEAARRVVLPGLEPRGAALAEIRLGESGLTVIAAHLGLTPGPRRHQIARIAAKSEKARGPVLLMGDLNEPRIRGGCLQDLGEAWSLVPPARSFPASRPLVAFDRIAMRGGLHLIDYAVHATPLARQASDHLPVYADLALGDAA
jgi:endonuclease/exonuclease/phosphatase family metal-dependent hydrolase